MWGGGGEGSGFRPVVELEVMVVFYCGGLRLRTIVGGLVYSLWRVLPLGCRC